ncbi:MAG: formylglycine-generating enzyme family protein [Myxococcales bacterium]|nr:formylglycine-generating enzyme family protein [Myxococcales bacterium]
MIRVPAGEFLAGCNRKVDRVCRSDEDKLHLVRLDAFSIDRTEVTVEDYSRCLEAGQCSAEGLESPFIAGAEQAQWAWACNFGKADRARHPVNCLTFEQAAAFCRWKGKRLPTEMEWERAARGTDGRKFPWGNTGLDKPRANLADDKGRKVFPSAVMAVFGYDDGYVGTAPVGSFPDGKAPEGLLDMAGNVWEWTADGYQDQSYPAERQPFAKEAYRVIRGGSFLSDLSDLRTSRRGRARPSERNPGIGFRCASDP